MALVVPCVRDLGKVANRDGLDAAVGAIARKAELELGLVCLGQGLWVVLVEPQPNLKRR